MRKREEGESWVIYQAVIKGLVCGPNAVCDQQEWEAMERARPGAQSLVQCGIATEGAAERLLHNYALSILVPDQHYGAVAGWVEQTHLGNRLVYYRVRERRPASLSGIDPQSLVRKLAIRPDSKFFAWIEADLTQRFDHVCCETLDASYLTATGRPD